MGITHQLLKGGKFVEEWMVFDGLALLERIHVVGRG